MCAIYAPTNVSLLNQHATGIPKTQWLELKLSSCNHLKTLDIAFHMCDHRRARLNCPGDRVLPHIISNLPPNLTSLTIRTIPYCYQTSYHVHERLRALDWLSMTKVLRHHPSLECVNILMPKCMVHDSENSEWENDLKAKLHPVEGKLHYCFSILHTDRTISEI